jgi:hypothetical protein
MSGAQSLFKALTDADPRGESMSRVRARHRGLA